MTYKVYTHRHRHRHRHRHTHTHTHTHNNFFINSNIEIKDNKSIKAETLQR